MNIPIAMAESEKPPLDDMPIVIRVPSNISKFTTNLKVLGYIYQEKLIHSLRGKLPDEKLQSIEKLTIEVITKLI